jgi:hypothetical protein
MPCQPNRYIQLKVTKNVLIVGSHVLKIYKHMFNYESSHMSKSQLNLT